MRHSCSQLASTLKATHCVHLLMYVHITFHVHMWLAVRPLPRSFGSATGQVRQYRARVRPVVRVTVVAADQECPTN